MRRPEKVAELVREEITQIVGFELEDPRVASVTVTEVRMTENLRDAKVYVTVAGTEEEKQAALVALRKAAPYVRRQLGHALNMRYTPEIHFVRDTIEESATRVADLLAELGQQSTATPADAPAGDNDHGEADVAATVERGKESNDERGTMNDE